MTAQSLLGSSILVFVVITGILAGFAAFRTGQAVAETWRPYWPVPASCLLLCAATRFLVWGLFQGDPWSPGGIGLGLLVLILIGTVAWSTTRAHKMVRQYPWLFERTGPFSWRPLPSGEGDRQDA